MDCFPSLSVEQYKQAVQWVGEGGEVRSGMYAVFTCLLYWNEEWVRKLGGVLCGWYEQGGLFKKYADWQYRWIANHRGFMRYVVELVLGDSEMMKGYESTSGKIFYGLRRAVGAKVMFVYTMSLVGLVGYYAYDHLSKKMLLAETVLMAMGLLCGLQMMINPPKLLRYFFLSLGIAVFVMLLLWL